MKKYIVLWAIGIVGVIGFVFFAQSPTVVEKIVEVQSECEECIVSESVVYQDVVKEVIVEKIVEVPIEKIVYKECKKETSQYIEVRSFSTYPQSESMKFFITTNLVTDSALQVYPANQRIRYSSVRTTEHVLEANKLIPGIKYHYKITFTTKEGVSLNKEGEFVAN